MRYLKQILILFVSTVVLNVWLLRFNKATIYRGGDSTNMIEEFLVYGIEKPFLYLVGAIKIAAALGLLLGLFYKKFIIPCASIITVLMIGAVAMHFKVSDEAHKFFPAAFMLLCGLSIIILSRRETKISS
ncbi:MAG: hypothetical protein CMP79_01755 [Formosa sp.]|nr:hypothetical protein [Formosa sp.]